MSASNQEPAATTERHTGREALSSEQPRNNLPVRVVRDVRLLLIAIWLGASVFFSFVVAPSVFAVLPARELAGAVVSRTLGIMNTGGFAISLVLLASAFLFKNIVSNRAFGVEIAALVLIALSTFSGKWIIATRMQSLRAAMGRPIDEVAQSDPLRIAFNSLHGYSVAALSVGMLAAIITLMLIARRAGR